MSRMARGAGADFVKTSESEAGAAGVLGRAARRRSRRSAASRPTITAWTARSRGPAAAGARRITELADKYGLGVANVFHAGDGNLHPLILYDADHPGRLEQAEAFGADILKLCVAVGGVLTGEHGVGVEKRDLMGEMFDETDLACQQRVKCAFDPGAAAQSRQGVPGAAPLRRAGPGPCPSGQGRLPRAAAVLMRTDAMTVLKPTTPEEVRASWPRPRQGAPHRGDRRRHQARRRRPMERSTCSTLRLDRIVDYAPDELVLTAGAGARLADIEKLVAARGQMLAFEPPRWRGCSARGAAADPGRRAGGQPLRPAAHRGRRGARPFPGLRGGVRPRRSIQGRRQGGQERHRLRPDEADGRVLGHAGGAHRGRRSRCCRARRHAGAWSCEGLEARTPPSAPLGEGLNSPHEVSGAAHLPAGLAARSGVSSISGAGAATTVLRLEGFTSSVEYRCRAVRDALTEFGPTDELSREESERLWREIGDGALLAEPRERVVWRLSVPPSSAAAIADAIQAGIKAEMLFDWGGGLIWAAVGAGAPDGGAAAIRGALAAHRAELGGGGHATLIRAPESLRARRCVGTRRCPRASASRPGGSRPVRRPRRRRRRTAASGRTPAPGCRACRDWS